MTAHFATFLLRRTALALSVCLFVALGAACGSNESDSDDNNDMHHHDGDHDAGHDATHELDDARAKATESGAFYVSYAPSPDPIPFNELFELDVDVFETEAMENPIAGADVSVQVMMPAHGHGMTTEPVVTESGDGTYRVEGMKFHMQSNSATERWEIAIGVDHDGTSDTATFEVLCCEE